MITFPVSDVPLAEDLLPEHDYFEALEIQLEGVIESCAWQHKKLVPSYGNAFLKAVHRAFDTHRPLILSPDHLWLVLCQGLAIHIRQNQEALRHHFVGHEGKKVLEVQRPDFQMGNPLNPWPEMIAGFSEQIKAHIGQHHDLITAQFSTTGELEKTAFEVTLMDAMEGYFVYLGSLCGIPSITLEGTPEDWQHIAERIQRFRQFDLDWWINPLEPVVAEFAAASRGHINTEFWQSFYKLFSQSGGPYISGHVIKLFPYLTGYNEIYRSPYIEKDPPEDWEMGDQGIKAHHVPPGMSQAPFILDDGHQQHKMIFFAGFTGILQDHSTLALRPEIGWAVRNVAVYEEYIRQMEAKNQR